MARSHSLYGSITPNVMLNFSERLFRLKFPSLSDEFTIKNKMSKYKKNQQPSNETIDEAMKISKGIQRPNQTKEQTKLIAQGIQKGIAEYKKQQKGKARELGRLKKKITRQQQDNASIETVAHEEVKCHRQWLPWILLIISWLGMAVFLALAK